MRDEKARREARAPAALPGGNKPANRDVGQALRSVYSQTVSEEIPTELLDLLGKLD